MAVLQKDGIGEASQGLGKRYKYDSRKRREEKIREASFESELREKTHQ